MNDLLSYLSAQARSRPASTVRFVAGELWRRSRARLRQELDRGLPEVGASELVKAAPLFLPPVLPSLRPGVPARWMEHTLERAERIVRGDVEIFGAWVPLGVQPDWHCDWLSGHRWPLAPAGALRVLDAPPGADVKRPWEAARFHQALALGTAGVLSGEAKFARTFAHQVGHWIEENPWPRGIHWAMPMEAGLRAINWIQAAAFFSACGHLEPGLARELSRSLFLHGRHLWAYREWNPVARANHYLACVVALLWLGSLFEATAEGREWLAFARRELLREMEGQTGADGVAHEGSSNYHAFVAELFFSGALLLARRDARTRRGANGAASNGHLNAAIERATSPQFAARLTRMFGFLAALCAGREVPPIWGDADDGRVLPFAGTTDSPVIALSAIASVLQGPAAAQPVSPDPGRDAEVFWRFGCVAQDPPAPPAHRSQAFADSGFYFFSSPRLRGSIRCGPLGVSGWSNHAHNDQLSFEFAVDGRAVLVDPGLPCYSEDRQARNLFRSTRWHNTVEVAGAEQNRFWPALLFRIVDDTHSRAELWQQGAAGTHFVGSHRGYLRLPQRVLVRRELRLTAQNELTIRDILEFTGPSSPAEARWCFHLAPHIQPEPIATADGTGDEAARQASCWRFGPVLLSVKPCPGLEGLTARRVEGSIAPRFGRKLAAPILEFQGTLTRSTEVIFTFTPADHSEAGTPRRVLL
jgi:uncharacterized heparinase superfamily protein